MMVWEIAYALGAIVLVAAMVYGVIQSGRRKAANEPITEQATKELYQRPDAYADHREDELRALVK